MADAVYQGRLFRRHGLRRRAVRRPMISGVVLASGLLMAACSAGDEVDGPVAAESTSDPTVDFGGDDGSEPTTDAEPAPGDTEESDDTTSTSVSAANADDAIDADAAAIEAEAERVIQRNWEIWVECTTDTESCDPATALAETESTTSRFYMESVGVVELWKRQGIAYRPVEGRPVDRFVRIQSIDVAPDLASAEVLLCDRDDRAQFQQTAGGDYEMVAGTDIGEDLLLRRVVALEGDEWKIVDNELLDRRHVEEGIDPLC